MVKKTIKELPKVEKKEPEKKVIKEKDPNQKLIDKRNALIVEVRSSLLSNAMLKRGGSEARRIHQQEIYSHNGVINEINVIGKYLGLGITNLGKLRK